MQIRRPFSLCAGARAERGAQVRLLSRTSRRSSPALTASRSMLAVTAIAEPEVAALAEIRSWMRWLRAEFLSCSGGVERSACVLVTQTADDGHHDDSEIERE